MQILCLFVNCLILLRFFESSLLPLFFPSAPFALFQFRLFSCECAFLFLILKSISVLDMGTFGSGRCFSVLWLLNPLCMVLSSCQQKMPVPFHKQAFCYCITLPDPGPPESSGVGLFPGFGRSPVVWTDWTQSFSGKCSQTTRPSDTSAQY